VECVEFRQQISTIEYVCNTKRLPPCITISNVVSEKWKLGRFLLRFHALVDVYPADFLGFLAKNQFLD